MIQKKEKEKEKENTKQEKKEEMEQNNDYLVAISTLSDLLKQQQQMTDTEAQLSKYVL
jgi:hypothetical protein